MALGLRCKQLIDAGRCAWLRQTLAPAAGGSEGAAAAVLRVEYIDAQVSGENTLLLLGQPQHL